MNPFVKVLVVAVLLLSAAFAVSQMLLHSKRVNWRDKCEVAEATLEVKTGQADKLDKDLRETVRERDDLKASKDAEIARLEEDITTKGLEIEELDREKESLRTYLDERRIRVRTLEGLLDTKDEENKRLTQKAGKRDEDLQGYMAQVEDLEKDGRENADTIDGLNDQIAALEKEKSGLTEDRDALELVIAGLEERGIHIPLEGVPIIDAKVCLVDQTLGAVVLNKGKDDGVKVGYPFTIYRDEKFIAKVYVLDAREGQSLARVDKALKYWPMEVGDSATTLIH